MTSAVLIGYAVVLAGCVAAMLALRRARWVWRVPRAGIATWQALGLALGLALIGLPLAFGLAPYRTAVAPALADLAGGLVSGDLASVELPAGMGGPRLAAVAVGLLIAGRLLWVTAACLLRTWRAQRRHRSLLALVGRADPEAPGALVLDHPRATAYCLPGLRPTIVVSAGTLDLLRGEELAAVLCHERSHASERHDLVLLPFTALRRALPLRWLRAADDAVALLVEMRADDLARRRYPDALSAALQRFAATATGRTPAGALAAADRAVAIRVQRLRERRRPPVVRGALVLAAAWGLAGAAAVLLPVLGG